MTTPFGGLLNFLVHAAILRMLIFWLLKMDNAEPVLIATVKREAS